MYSPSLKPLTAERLHKPIIICFSLYINLDITSFSTAFFNILAISPPWTAKLPWNTGVFSASTTSYSKKFCNLNMEWVKDPYFNYGHLHRYSLQQSIRLTAIKRFVMRIVWEFEILFWRKQKWLLKVIYGNNLRVSS